MPLAAQDGRAAGAEFDMFAEEAEPATTAPAERSTAAAAGLADSYDDADGYYNLQVRFRLVQDGFGRDACLIVIKRTSMRFPNSCNDG